MVWYYKPLGQPADRRDASPTAASRSAASSSTSGTAPTTASRSSRTSRSRTSTSWTLQPGRLHPGRDHAQLLGHHEVPQLQLVPDERVRRLRDLARQRRPRGQGLRRHRPVRSPSNDSSRRFVRRVGRNMRGIKLGGAVGRAPDALRSSMDRRRVANRWPPSRSSGRPWRGSRSYPWGRAASPKMRTRAPRIDARGRAEVLSEIEQHVDHARPRLPRRRERTNVIAIADDLPFAAEDAVHRQRQTDGEPVHASAGAACFVSLDDEVPVVLLDRKVNHSKAVERCARDRAAQRLEHARRSE